jgi:hypothetical protein
VILPVLPELGQTRNFCLVHVGGRVEDARADAMLVERTIAQIVEHRAGPPTAQQAQRIEAVAIRAIGKVFMPTSFLFNPCSPLAASTAWPSVASGTTWPPTKPPATRARKNGQGLSGETGIWPAGVSLEAVPAFSFGTDMILKCTE